MKHTLLAQERLSRLLSDHFVGTTYNRAAGVFGGGGGQGGGVGGLVD